MTVETLLLVAAGLVGIGVYGALSQQSFVMILMGLELVLNGTLLATATLWVRSAAAVPEGQMLALVVLAVMAVEMTIGFALVVAVYRAGEADVTEATAELRG